MEECKSEKFDEEPQKAKKTDEYVDSSVRSDSVKHGDAFSKLNRELQDEDLNNRGTQRLLLNELDKYEMCKTQLEEYREKFHSADKTNAVLSARLSSSTAFEITNSCMITIGSILIGLTPSILEGGKTYYLTWIILAVGLIALSGGIISKIVIRKK